MQLILDFADTGRRVYRDAVRIITARHVSEVLPALREIEAAVGAGFFAAGYLAYEAAPAFDPALKVRPGNRLPLLCFGLFREFDRTGAPVPEPAPGPRGWTIEPTRTEFNRAIDAIRSAIAEGRTYQVNYTTRFRGHFDASSGSSIYSYYEQLRAAQGGGYHALLNIGQHHIVSASPELFFQRRGTRITTRPMKGTRARGRWTAEDDARARELAASEKDRAENLMIVDLLRNDLGRVARTGSVHVDALYTVERYRTVHQLTSTISAEVDPNLAVSSILRMLFPCGSVTGAPKVSTMEIIAGLETSPREVYCGAIGFIDPGGDCTFSVPIRTLWIDGDSGECEYGSGAGITYDSSATQEYDEVVAKAALLNERWPAFELFETMRVENGSVCRRARHLRRLAASARYFDFPFDEATARAAVDQAIDGLPAGVHRLRLFVGATGALRTSVAIFVPDPATRSFAFSSAIVSSSDRFLYHKTTNRRIYEQVLSEHPEVFDVLLRNERGEVTEFTRGNLVVDLDGDLLTPPLDSGLLPGTFREELLESGIIRERVLTADDVRAARRVWLVNSLRQWVALCPAGERTAPHRMPA